jgi:Zn-dependent peptidase ImmA (M78 family)
MKFQGATATLDRRAIANQAMQGSITARMQVGMDLQSPICIYALCKAYNVPVRFNSINMEGMYQRGTPSRIHLSALRPLPRRSYNCAHEFGHHFFSHGSSIDELQENAKAKPWEDPKEFLADTFAGFLLMPTLGLRRAFAARSWRPETATPTQMFQVACEFGVGYLTLITHLAYGVGMISRARATTLQKASPKAIRAELLSQLTPGPLIVADGAWASPTLDAEVGAQLLLPPRTVAANSTIIAVRDLPNGRLFEAVRPGITRVTQFGSSWAVFARVARKEYVGLAEFRHLEDDPDE